MFGQTIELADLVTVAFLVVLEGALSIDNALVLGMLARRLPRHQQAKALTYGLIGALVFRITAICFVGWLLKWWIVKLLGGGYLVYISVKHFFFESQEEDAEVVKLDDKGHPILVHEESGEPLAPGEMANEIQARTAIPLDIQDDQPGKQRKLAGFWSTVAVIELTDIAFAVDSIMAAIGFIPSVKEDETNPKLWVVILGGFVGVILMRVAAKFFIGMLEKFPRFELAAYLLVVVIGIKLVVDWGLNSPEHPHNIDFHSPSHVAFWAFWLTMVASFCVGFIPPKKKPDQVTGT